MSALDMIPGSPERAALLQNAVKGRSLWDDAGRRLLRNKAAVTGMIVLALMVLLALIVFPIVSYILVQNALLMRMFGGLTVPEWLTVAMTAFALFGIIQRLSLAARVKD